MKGVLRVCGLLFLVVGAASFGAVHAAELAEEQVLRVGLHAADIGPMDPHQPNLAQDTPIQDAVWELLVNFNVPGDVTSDIAPGLAESWEVSSDGLTWTFHLRKGVLFHKGYGEMTAEDVKYSFDRVRDPQRSGKVTQPPWPWIQEVEIIDRYTIKLLLDQPVPDLLPYLAFMQNGGQILCKKAVEEKGGRIQTDLIGTGPWMWDGYQPQEYITLVKNPNYWRGEPTLERITYYYMESIESRMLAFLNKELDSVAEVLDEAWVRQIEGAGGIVDALGPGVSAVFAFNLTKPPLDNWLVRAAIAYAIDRQEIVDAIGPWYTTPQYSTVPETWLFGTYEDMPKYEYDPEKAKALLAAAGYPQGFELEVFISPRPYYRTRMEVVQAQLKRVGINLKLNMVDHTTFHANQRQDLNPLVLFGNGGYNGEMHLWQFYHSSSVVTKATGMLNFSHYGDVVGSIDGILEAAQGKSPEVKTILYARAQRQLLNDLAVYPLDNQLIPVARQPYFDLGYEPRGTTTGSWYNIWWEAKILKH